MEKWLTREDLYYEMETSQDLKEEEALSRTINGRRMSRMELLEREVRELSFHISRFASEGALLDEINDYSTLLEYVNLLMERRQYARCAKFVTILELFMELDVGFVTFLPKLSEEMERKGPISFDALVKNAKRAINNKKRGR